MPLNVLDTYFSSFEAKVLPKTVSLDLGVIGMKSLASSFALRAAQPVECLHQRHEPPGLRDGNGMRQHGTLGASPEDRTRLQAAGE